MRLWDKYLLGMLEFKRMHRDPEGFDYFLLVMIYLDLFLGVVVLCARVLPTS